MTDYTQLVERARLGDKESMEALAEGVRGRLYAYVYRIVLRDHLAQDIVQETLLEMFKVLGKLEQADKFWPWLRAIAFNKIRRHHTNEKKHRTAAMAKQNNTPDDDPRTGLTSMVTDELKQLVVAAMAELKPRHRKVLTMRCYEEMDYAEIAGLMGCTELSARVLFCRAKRSLQRSLSRRGLKRGFMVTALVVFGKATAHSEAAAASISITSATTSAGVTAGLISAASSKSAIVALAAAGALAVGAVTVNSMSGQAEPTLGGDKTVAAQANGATTPTTLSEESWYYYPLAPGGPVMMRLVTSDSKTAESYTQWWQDGSANYHYDKNTNILSINNHRTYNEDLSVFRLPTDGVNLTDFLNLVAGKPADMDYVSATGKGLLVLSGRGQDGNFSRTLRHYNVLDEEYFKYNWPPGAKVVDNRDEMHQQGWAWMRIAGRVGPCRVSGTGRIPFVYNASVEHYPWIRLNVEGRYEIIDDGTRARVFDASNQLKGVYAGGEFFVGLSRPWMGLHTIDTVRRDAATRRYWFDTEYSSDKRRSQVTMTCGDTLITYSIDMDKDLIESITFAASNNPQKRLGELQFSYVEGSRGDAAEFNTPRQSASGQQYDRLGTLWLLKLANTDMPGN